MVCKQRSCQRNKNLKQSGYCNVCEEAITASNKAREKEQRNTVNNTVETDLKLMISTHEKLVKGEAIDKDVVNILVLGGVVNILGQHDRIVEIENKVKALEIENITQKSRIESLENWILKQDVSIKDLDEKLHRFDKDGTILKESVEVTEIKKKVVSLELDISALKVTRQEILSKPDSSEAKKSLMKKCNLCDETFARNSDFENHMVDTHEAEKKFECEVCGKRFLLQWRLQKHQFIHTGEAKSCKYFLNNVHCPFDKVGCMFSHSAESVDVETHEDIENVEDDYNIEENQCHLCKSQLDNRDELWEHVENNHEEYFQDMLEVARANRS